MRKSARLPVIVVTVLLVIYVLLILLHTGLNWAGLIFFLSPFGVIWMVYSVIRHDTYRGRELKEEEEWGYSDQS